MSTNPEKWAQWLAELEEENDDIGENERPLVENNELSCQQQDGERVQEQDCNFLRIMDEEKCENECPLIENNKPSYQQEDVERIQGQDRSFLLIVDEEKRENECPLIENNELSYQQEDVERIQELDRSFLLIVDEGNRENGQTIEDEVVFTFLPSMDGEENTNLYQPDDINMEDALSDEQNVDCGGIPVIDISGFPASEKTEQSNEKVNDEDFNGADILQDNLFLPPDGMENIELHSAEESIMEGASSDDDVNLANEDSSNVSALQVSGVSPLTGSELDITILQQSTCSDLDVDENNSGASSVQGADAEITNTDINENHIDTSETGRKRRRFADPSTWERNVRKKLKNTGQSYINRKKEIVPAKQWKQFECKCRFRCSANFHHSHCQRLFDEFWRLEDTFRKKDYVCSLVVEEDVKRKRKRDRANKKTDVSFDKTVSRVYFLTNQDRVRTRVCLAFFCNTFAISKKFVNNAVKFKNSNGCYGGEDRRIGRPPPNSTPVATMNEIKEFLEKFPKVPSHYSRERSQRLYLAPDLSIAALYRLYIQENRPLVTEAVFRRAFRLHEPPLSIFRPKKDQCTVCEQFERTKQTTDKYSEHVKRKNEINDMKKGDAAAAKTDPSLLYGSFDLQAILTLPFAGDCQIYYKRKLSVYNFTIFDSKGQGTCFLWDEVNGKKGSAEIGTSLIKYLASADDLVRNVVLYADTCGGQNRNQNIVAAMLYVVNKKLKPNLETVDIKFMESGHSYLEADSMHATIERKKRHSKVYTTDGFKVLIEMSRQHPKPYTVHKYKYDEIFDLETLSKTIINNRTKDVDGEKVNWLRIKWFRFEKNSSVVKFKYDVSEDNFKEMVVSKTKIVWERIKLRKRYSAPIKISEKKKKDLLSLIDAGVIPQEFQDFYIELPSASGVRDVAVWERSSIDED